MTAHWASLCAMATMVHLHSLQGTCNVLFPSEKKICFLGGPYFRSKIPIAQKYQNWYFGQIPDLTPKKKFGKERGEKRGPPPGIKKHRKIRKEKNRINKKVLTKGTKGKGEHTYSLRYKYCSSSRFKVENTQLD